MHFRFAIRHILRSRIYSVIILLSLVVGFACSNLLISFLISESTTDSFHTKKDRIFQIFSDNPFGGTGRIPYTLSVIPDYLTSNYPESEKVAQLLNVEEAVLSTDAGKFYDLTILSTNQSFFSVFDFPIYRGQATALNSQGIILTRDRASVLFGEEDVVGRTLTFSTSDTSRMLTVTAVIDRIPENSHLVFDALIDNDVLGIKNSGGPCYVLLKDGSAYKEFESKINFDKGIPGLTGTGKGGYRLEPLVESYFEKDNTMPFMKTRNKLLIWIGCVVCGLVLFMASFNFINLFMLSLQERKKETGIRKTLGVSFANLIKACTAEVVIYLSLALTLSLLLTWLMLPAFNKLLQTNLSFSYISHVKVFPIIGLVVFLLGILVILIAVSRQWRVQPISLMRNNVTSRLTFNRFLFTIQFVISITLVICSATIIRQINFLENEPLGFNRNMIQLNSFSTESSRALPALKQNLLQIRGIGGVTVCSGNPVSGNMIVLYDLGNGEIFSPYLFSGDEDFIKTLDLKLIEGVLPVGDHDKLVNEKLVRHFSMANPLGATIPGTKDKIVGVVRDFTCVSFKQEIPPVIISYTSTNRNLLVDFSGQEVGTLLPQIQSAWQKNFPDQPFTFQLIQQDLAKKYKEDTFFYKLVVSFSIVSMIISCFGLFALSWAVTQSRMKEIGIRKVLGATAKDILNLLTKTFTLRIAIAFMIAAPSGYFLMDKWLSNFVNKAPVSVWIYIFSLVVVIMIACATLFLQTFKAAIANPVDELRTE